MKLYRWPDAMAVGGGLLPSAFALSRRSLRSGLLRSVVVAAATVCATTQAQVAPDAGQLQRRSEQQLAPAAPVTPPRAARPAAPVDRSGPQLTVRRFVIEGATLVPAQELAAQLAPWQNKPATLGELQAAAEALVGIYRARGWYARVQIPPQDVSDGTLRVRVVEGRFGRLHSQLAPGARADAATIEQLVGGSLTPGAPYSQDALERGLLLANDLPGVRVDGLLQAGQARGTSDLALQIQDEPLFTGQATLSNAGSRFTGRAQASAQLALNNPRGPGDQVTANLLAAERLGYLGLGYSLPVGSDGLRARIGATALRYRLGESFEALDARGRSRSVTAGLSWPWLRSEDRSAWLGMDATHGRYDDEMLGAPQRQRRVSSLAFSAWGNASDGFNGGGLSDWRLALTTGRLKLGLDEASDAAGPQAAGSFARINLDLRRDQQLAEPVYLRARLAAQWASKNLDSSQKFGLGGAWGVRAFPGDDGQGDSGVLLQLEVHRPLPQGLDAFAFVEGGQVRQHKTPWAGWDTRGSGHNSYGLAAAGLGLNWSHPSGWQASLVLAEPLGNNPGSGNPGHNQDGGRTRTRGWLSVAARF